MSILSMTLPFIALLGAAATPVQAESEPNLLGGCILTSPIGEVPDDLYQESGVVATDEYGPFTKKLSVYGITLIARDDASDGFMKRVAQTIKEIFPQDERMDPALQEELLKNLYRYRTTIPVPKGRDMDFVEQDEAVWRRVKSQNTICDIIMELGSVPGQVMEVVEHILHFVSDVGLHYTFPNEWGISKKSKLWDAMQEAVEKGYYDISSYADIGEEEVRNRVALQEFAYWFISTAWNLQEPYGPQGEEEWTIKNASDLQAKLPDFYEAYEQTVGKVMVAPSLSTLEKFGPKTTDGEAPSYNIVFARQAKDATELFSFNTSDEKIQQLTSSVGFAGFPVWSPEGDRIAFLAEEDGGMALVAMETSTGDISVLIPDMSNPADWGPEGKQMLITKDLDGDGRGLFIVDLSDGSEKRVPTGSSEDAYARWSGSAITYESGRDGNPEIYRTDLETGKTTRLTDNPGLDEWPSFSPNGRRIAWASGSEEEKDLWIMQADGSGKKQLTKGMLFGDAFPEWSPNGRQIMLTVREDDVFVLKLIDIETGHVTHIGEGAQPSWR